mgnify:CR=1 FL=1
MKKALQHIVSSIVDNPKDIEIKEEEVDGIINFTIKVAEEDMGKIIGKNGKVIRAVRNLMRMPAIKQNKRINITLFEPPKQ